MKRAWIYLKETPTWVWVALFLISAIISVSALRHNNFEMIKRRDALFVADKSGLNVEQALNDLRAYVYSHMNTNLASGNNPIKPPIQLKYTYERLVKAEQKQVSRTNDRVYQQAEAYCRQSRNEQFRGDCFKTYVDSRSISAQPIPAALYQFDFISPTYILYLFNYKC